MRKFAFTFALVVLASMTAATLGHMYCRQFCIATKPVLWPFLYLAAYAVRYVVKTHNKEKQK